MNCKICLSQKLNSVFQHQSIPEYNLSYFETREAALSASQKSVNFVQCNECGYLFNQDYSQLDYKIFYESGRNHSEFFKKYLSKVADYLIKRIDEDNVSSIVEIGAGDGKFAEEISNRMPSANYYAYDSSWERPSKHGKISYRNKYYSQEEGLSPQLVIARHVLEHQIDVVEFSAILVSENPKYIFIEIPCSKFVLSGKNYHYFSYEHCSYLDKTSLNLLMRKHDYYCAASSYVFNKENLISVFKKNENRSRKSEKKIPNFLFNEDFQNWKSLIKEKINSGSLIWGAAGKGVMLLNLLDLDYTKMPDIIDVNPKIENLYIPVTGNRICNPKNFNFSAYKKVFIVNELYQKEIENILKEKKCKMAVEPLL